MPRTNEVAFNAVFLQALLQITPKWKTTSGAEQVGVLENQQLQPDMTIRTPGGHTVVVESEYVPAHTVENDAINRLGEKFYSSNTHVDTVVALRIPKTLQESNVELMKAISNASFQFCVFTGSKENSNRWPTSGWIVGSLRDFANCVDHISISEDLLTKGMNAFEETVRQCSEIIRRASFLGEHMWEKYLGETLNQQPGPQTTRMAMAIVVNVDYSRFRRDGF